MTMHETDNLRRLEIAAILFFLTRFHLIISRYGGLIGPKIWRRGASIFFIIVNYYGRGLKLYSRSPRSQHTSSSIGNEMGEKNAIEILAAILFCFGFFFFLMACRPIWYERERTRNLSFKMAERVGV